MTDELDDAAKRAADIESLILSNAQVSERLDREQYWRVENEARRTRWRWTAFVGGFCTLALLIGIGIVAVQGRDTADAVHQTQLTGTPTGRVLLCAASPDVLDATTREQQRQHLDACFARNGVSVYAFIKPPPSTTTTTRSTP